MRGPLLGLALMGRTVLAKALAVGIATGLLAPVVVWVVASLGTLFAGYYIAGPGVDVHVHDTYVVMPFGPEHVVTQVAAGFAVGFSLTVWRDW